MSNPTRIPIALIWDDVTQLGGVNTWLYQLVDLLPSRGLEAWLVDMGERESGRIDIAPWRHRVLTLRQGSLESACCFRKRVYREFQKRDIRLAVLQEHRFGDDLIACLPKGFPVSNVIHVDRPDSRYLQLALELDPYLVEQYCVSPRILDKFLPLLAPDRRERVFFLPLGVEIPADLSLRSLSPEGPIRVVYAGRLSQGQTRVLDIPAFLEAVTRLHLPVQMDVYGAGEDEVTLRQASAAWIQNGTLALHGSRSQAEVFSALANAHVMILFSDYEGIPLILLEAMARGTVPIVTDIPSGIRDLLTDNVNSKLYPPRQPEKAATILQELLQNPAQYTTLAKNACDLARQYNISHCTDSYAEHFRSTATSSDIYTQPIPRLKSSGWKQTLRDHLPRCITQHLR